MDFDIKFFTASTIVEKKELNHDTRVDWEEIAAKDCEVIPEIYF
jgi:hypothetical protein